MRRVFARILFVLRDEQTNLYAAEIAAIRDELGSVPNSRLEGSP